MIQAKIKIILIEDNTADAILIERQIKKIISFPNILHITDFEELVSSLDKFRPDLIICDYQLSGFTGMEVLSYINEYPRFIPFIFITGTINDEELAASTILTGATGYILKKHINSLHEKLLPFFEKIIEERSKETLTSKHKKMFEEIQDYLKNVEVENEIIKASYREMRRALDKIKSLNK